MNSSTKVGERIANLESGFRAVRDDMRDLRVDVEKMDQRHAASQSTLFTKIDELANVIAQRSRTPWGTVFGAMSVLLVIIGAFAQGPLSQLERNRDTIDNNSRITSQVPGLVTRVDSLETRIAAEIIRQADRFATASVRDISTAERLSRIEALMEIKDARK